MMPASIPWSVPEEPSEQGPEQEEEQERDQAEQAREAERVEEERTAEVRIWRCPCRWGGELPTLDQTLSDPQVVGVDAQACHNRQQGDGQ